MTATTGAAIATATTAGEDVESATAAVTIAGVRTAIARMTAVTTAARLLEQRAAAFRIDIDDVLTGGQPAARDNAPVVAASTKPRPLPSNAPIAQPSGFAGSFAWPLHGTILSRFGPGQSGSKNNGIDIAAPVGTPIRASADGVVAAQPPQEEG